MRSKARAPRMVALLLAAGALAGCSSTIDIGTVDKGIDMIPTAAGGLPSNAPQRSATPPQYPAVNAMPQHREALPLTDDELNRTKSELTTLRNKQEEMAGTAPKPAAAPEKKQADAAKGAAKGAKKPKQPTELSSAKDQSK